MHRALRRRLFGFLLLYGAFFFQSFVGGWFPVEVIRPELDFLVLGFYALEGQPLQAMLLGFWNGLLRDSLTQGPAGRWTFSLTLVALVLALRVRDRRFGIVKKTLFLFTAILVSQTLVFLFQERGIREEGMSLPFFLHSLLPGSCLTAILFLPGAHLFKRWLSTSESTQIND